MGVTRESLLCVLKGHCAFLWEEWEKAMLTVPVGTRVPLEFETHLPDNDYIEQDVVTGADGDRYKAKKPISGDDGIALSNREYWSFIGEETVDTILDLEEMTTTPDRVFVRGYWNKEDNAFNGNVFKRVAQDAMGININAVNATYQLQYTGAVDIKWFGAKCDGGDDTEYLLKARNYMKANNGGELYFSESTSCGELDFSTVNNTIIRGDGANTIIDFKYANVGEVGLKVGVISEVGGTQKVEIHSIGLNNTNYDNKLSALLKIESGSTGQSPSETSGFFTLRNIFTGQNATYGIWLNNISHITADGISQMYKGNNDEGIHITADININTGVYAFQNCAFRGRIRAMKIRASVQLIDSISFNGCGFFNHVASDSSDAITLDGSDAQISSVTFDGCHVEARNNDGSNTCAIRYKGKVKNVVWDGSHISGGTSDNETHCEFGVLFEDGGNYGGIEFNSVEFLRVRDKANSFGVGYVFGLMGSLSTYSKSIPIRFTGIWRNSTIPLLVKSESNEYNKSIICDMDYTSGVKNSAISRDTTIHDLEDSETPNVAGGRVFRISSAHTVTQITNFGESYYGQEIVIMTKKPITIKYVYNKIHPTDDRDVNMRTGDTITFILDSSGVWREVSRAVVTSGYGTSSISEASSRTILNGYCKSTSIITISPRDDGFGSTGYYINNKQTGSFDINSSNGSNVTANFDYVVTNI